MSVPPTALGMILTGQELANPVVTEIQQRYRHGEGNVMLHLIDEGARRV